MEPTYDISLLWAGLFIIAQVMQNFQNTPTPEIKRALTRLKTNTPLRNSGKFVQYIVQKGPSMERIQFDKDVKPISEFRANVPSLIDQVHRTKRPLVITQHGKSVAILMDVQEYEALLEMLGVLTDIGEAEEDIKKKRFYSSDKAMEKVRKKISK